MTDASSPSAVPQAGLLKRFVRHPVIMAERAAEIALGAAFLSSPVQRFRAWRLQHRPVPAACRAAIVVHLYYPELLDEALAVQAALPPGSPLLITAPPDQAARLRLATRGVPNVEIHEVANRGRDIAPFMKLLAEDRLDGFDAVLKIHGKRSPHLRHGDLRRRIFFVGLAGSRGNVARVLAHFQEPTTGFVGLGPYFRTRPLYWMSNRARVEALCQRMGAPARVGFFEGSMFWFRPAALEPLKRLQLRTEDFEAEAGQLDGTLHHAIERCFVLSGLAAGYEARSLSGRRLIPR